ncbi:MAG TPA: kelch repeat-containing protein [Balneolaceae bacterium]|nr:kelch repeat-containing protein [Balneolaceae bacterium]
MKKLVSILSVVLAVNSCDQPAQFHRSNANDPLSTNFYPDSIRDLQLNITKNYAQLSWKRGSFFNKKYQIIKANEDNKVIFETTVDSADTSFKDTSVSPFYGHYQINQITKQGTVVQNENRISFHYAIKNFQTSYIALNTRVLLKWEYNGYFNTDFIIKRSARNGTRELVKLSNAPYKFEDGHFSYDNIGLNTYSIIPQTTLERGAKSSSSIRLPRWEKLKNLPADMNDAHLATIDSSIYVIRASYSNFKYDISTDTWSKIAGNPGKFDRNRFIIQALTNNQILVLNGQSYELYDIGQDQWSSSTNVPYPWILGFASVQIDDRFVLLTGGDDEPSGGYEPNKETYLFDITTNTWSQSTDMGYPRSYHILIKIDEGKAIAMGGSKNAQKVELFDLNTKKWTALPDCPIYPRKAVQLENGYVLVLSKDQSVLFNTTTQVWSNPTSFAKNHYAYDGNDISLIALPDGNVLVMGLTKKIAYYNERGKGCQIFLFNENDWVQIGNSIDTRIRSYPFFTSDNRTVLIGGAAYDGRDSYETLDMNSFLKK